MHSARKHFCHMFEYPDWHSHPRSLNRTFSVRRHIIVIDSVIGQMKGLFSYVTHQYLSATFRDRKRVSNTSQLQ